MAKKRVYKVSDDVNVIEDKDGTFVEIKGVRVAQRGFPGTSQAETWVSIEPGWQVTGGADYETVDIRYTGASIN